MLCFAAPENKTNMHSFSSQGLESSSPLDFYLPSFSPVSCSLRLPSSSSQSSSILSDGQAAAAHHCSCAHEPGYTYLMTASIMTSQVFLPSRGGRIHWKSTSSPDTVFFTMHPAI